MRVRFLGEKISFSIVFPLSSFLYIIPLSSTPDYLFVNAQYTKINVRFLGVTFVFSKVFFFMDEYLQIYPTPTDVFFTSTVIHGFRTISPLDHLIYNFDINYLDLVPVIFW